MAGLEKGETAQVGFERQAIAREQLSEGKSPPDVAQLLSIPGKIDNAAGQNEFQKGLQAFALNRRCAVLELGENKTAGGSLERARDNDRARLA